MMRSPTVPRAVRMSTGVCSPRRAPRSQHLQSIQPGQAEVEQHHIGLKSRQRPARVTVAK
jgi:hypothetical protein